MTNKNMTTVNRPSVEEREFSILCPYRLLFLLENTSRDTKYIDVYKDAVNGITGPDRGRVIIVDHDRIVDLLQNDAEYIGVENDDAYRAAFKRAKTVLLADDGQIPKSLMVELTRLSIETALRKSACNNWHDVDYKNEHRNRSVSSSSSDDKVTTMHQHRVILTNFFDLDLVTEFLGLQQRVDAIVRLTCGEISRTRDKFVTKACLDQRSARAEKIRRFWRDLTDELNAEDTASTYKDVVVYAYESKYDARFEPPDPERIVATSRAYVFREMRRVQDFVSDARNEHDRFVENLNTTATYDFTAVDENGSWLALYESYAERLDEYPMNTIVVAVILDAMIAAICSSHRPAARRPDGRAATTVDDFFDAFRDGSDGDGCLNHPICVPYGNECARTVQKYGQLRFTGYAAATAAVAAARWRRTLWGPRPLLPLETETGYDETISYVKRRCASDDDVDVRLCALALNRLRSNLDVFRGEAIGLPGLDVTKVRFMPEFVEPLDCATMVQTLEKQSETRMRTSYAYFEPEDVILVGFYDFQDGTWTRESSFDFVMPQRPLHARDHFDFFRNHRVPKTPVYPALGPCVATYRERTEETRFCDGDCLTVARRRWRFGSDATCLVYKSKSYELVRHATDDVDRFRINTRAGGTYSFDKRHGDVIGFFGDDGTSVVEINTERNARTGAVCLQRTWRPSKGHSRTETCRRFGNGSVVVEFENGTRTVTYWACGKCVRTTVSGSLGSSTCKSHGNNECCNAIPLKSLPGGFGTTNRFTVPPTHRLGTPSGFPDPNQFKASLYNTAVPSTTSILSGASGTHPGIRNNASVPSSEWPGTAWDDNTTKTRKNRNGWIVDNHYDADFAISNCSDDGKRWTVNFEDGTEIVTHAQEVPVARLGLSEDWASFDVSKREYAHPDYRTVVEYSDGTVCVRDLVRRAPDGSIELRLLRVLRVEVTATAVDVYRDSRVATTSQCPDDDDSSKIATFPWAADVDSLFEKRDGKRRVVRCGRTTTTTTEVPSSRPIGPPSAAAYFIVKRNMTGFRLLDRDQYDEFVGQIDHDRAVVRETHDGGIVTLHDSDVQLDGGTQQVSQRRSADRGYEWLNVSFSSEADGIPVGTTTPKRLVSRTFRKLGADYGPILKALREARSRLAVGPQTTPTAKLVVSMRVPNLDSVKSLYAAQRLECERLVGRKDITRLFIGRLLRGTVFRPSTKLAVQREIRKCAVEAQMRLRTNSFIPYFRRDNYGPFRNCFTDRRITHNTHY